MLAKKLVNEIVIFNIYFFHFRYYTCNTEKDCEENKEDKHRKGTRRIQQGNIHSFCM